MEANKIDGLFKDKLADLATSPSAESWDKLDNLLTAKEKATHINYYKLLAACIVLLLVGTIVLFNVDFNSDTQISSTENSIDKIQEQVATEKNLIEQQPDVSNPEIKEEKLIPENKHETDNTLMAQVDKVDKTQTTIAESDEMKSALIASSDENSAIQKNESLENFSDLPMVTVQDDVLIASNIDKEDEPVKKRKRLPITIIYKRGNDTKALIAKEHATEPDTTSEKGQFFKSIINATRDITSGELLADIRDAKSNFINNGLEPKNSRIKNSK